MRQGIPFWKVQGAGNDALIIESRHFPKAKSGFVRSIAHRTLGMGADQVLEVIRAGDCPEIQIWNCDGSRAEMCANGTRSFLQFAVANDWVKRKPELPIIVSKQETRAFLCNGKIELSLGYPHVTSDAEIVVSGKRFSYTPVSTGNPHAVIFLPKPPKKFDYKVFGPAIEHHRNFPQRTNVEFVRKVKVSGKRVLLNVEAWERGAGATLSCGSGAVAAAAAHRERTGNKFNFYHVKMTRFTLTVRFRNNEAFLSGPSSTIAEGVYYLSRN